MRRRSRQTESVATACIHHYARAGCKLVNCSACKRILVVTPQEFGLLLVSIVASALGQFFLKVGALKLGKATASNLVNHVLSIVITPELLGGLVCYGLGAIAYILLLTRVKLSVVGPSAALIYVFSVLLGHFAFQESIPGSRVVGLGLIICGVVLVIWQR